MKENSALLLAEQRQAERHAPLESLDGVLSLSIEGQSRSLCILTLRDISPFGVGVESSLLVEKGRRIQLTYKEDGLALVVTGTVAWNTLTKSAQADTARQERYHLGIELCPSGMTNNVHFFRHMSGMQ